MDVKELSFKERIEYALQMQYSQEVMKNRLNVRLDLKVLDCDKETESWSEFLFEPREEFLNPYGGVHGGIGCTLLDTCGGLSVHAASRKAPSTTDMSVSYVHPMIGKAFRIRIDITLQGHRLYGVSGSIYDAETGVLCLNGIAKFILRDHVDSMKI